MSLLTLFKPTSQGFNSHNAQLLLWLSRLAYADKAEVVSYAESLLEVTAQDIHWYSSCCGSDVQLFILAQAEDVFIIFRGSESECDFELNNDIWLQDDHAMSKLAQQSEAPIRLHQGFLTAFLAVNTFIKQKLKQLIPVGDNKRIWLAGHSLGGALTTIAAAYIEFVYPEPYRIAGIYSYGSPRVGNVPFANLFSSQLAQRYYRIVNNNDLVPHLPPQTGLFGEVGRYTHVGERYYFTQDSVLLDHDLSWWQAVQDEMKGMVASWRDDDFMPDQISDHLIGHYLKQFQQVTGLILPRLQTIELPASINGESERAKSKGFA